MPGHWQPRKMWEGEDAFIIGGGPSLKNFNWDLLRDKNTIGCNSAIRLGFEVCGVCFFSDFTWFQANYDLLCEFPGLIVTHCSSLSSRAEGWLKWMPRVEEGLCAEGALSFNQNSGSSAVNLALQFGAKRVFLLGFDATLAQGEHHWNEGEESPVSGLYAKFQRGMHSVAMNLPQTFPGAEVINLSPISTIKSFPFMRAEDVLNQAPARSPRATAQQLPHLLSKRLVGA